MPNIDMLTTFSMRGSWWIPNPESEFNVKEIAGTLTFSPESVSISLLDTLIDYKVINFGLNAIDKYPLVVGCIENGNYVSLTNCRLYSEGMQATATSISKWRLETVDPILFWQNAKPLASSHYWDKAYIKLKGFNRWIGDSPVSRRINQSESQDAKHPPKLIGIIQEYNKPEEHIIEIENPKVVLKLIQDVSSGNPIGHAYIDYSWKILIEPAEPQSEIWFRDFTSELSALFGILSLTFLPCETVTLSMKSENSQNDIRAHMVFAQGDEVIRCCSETSRSLVPYKSVRGNLGEIIETYFSIKTDLDLIISTWLNTNPSIVGNVLPKYLSIIQALESYHIIRFKGKYLDDNLFNPIKQLLLNAIPSDVPEAMKMKMQSEIKRWHNYSLIDRLREIEEKLLAAVIKIIPKYDDQFMIRTKKNRNTISHGNSEKMPSSIEISQDYLVLYLILSSILLTELKVSAESIQVAVKTFFSTWYIETIQ